MKSILRLSLALVLALLPCLGPQRWNAEANQTFVGSATCATYHQRKHHTWLGSHHERTHGGGNAANGSRGFCGRPGHGRGVTSTFHKKDGRYFVRTDGLDGKLHDYPSNSPLAGIRCSNISSNSPAATCRALELAWHSRSEKQGGRRWFHIYPGEAMDDRYLRHWTVREQTCNYQWAKCQSTGLEKNYDLATDSYHTPVGRRSTSPVRPVMGQGPGM
jgi:hypothetical protein